MVLKLLLSENISSISFNSFHFSVNFLRLFQGFCASNFAHVMPPESVFPFWCGFFFIFHHFFRLFDVTLGLLPVSFIFSEFCPQTANQMRALQEMSHLALARYHLVAHPRDPTRLTRILSTVNAIRRMSNQENVIRLFFGNNPSLVLLCINNALS